MITHKDVGKTCFIRMYYITDEHVPIFRWENIGTKIAAPQGIISVLVKDSDGNLHMIKTENVRILEPRPQQNA